VDAQKMLLLDDNDDDDDDDSKQEEEKQQQDPVMMMQPKELIEWVMHAKVRHFLGTRGKCTVRTHS